MNEFEKENLSIFGPDKLAARLEGSKVFSKDFMAKYKIPTANYESFTDLESAQAYLKKMGAPIVVKASGLAAGKGAVVCETMEQADEAILSMLGPDAEFGEAGSEVVIEEFMIGEEASLFAVCDGESYDLLNTAQDHKRIFDGDKGPNTGGMGAYSPAPVVTPELLERVEKEIIQPTLDGMKAEGCPYKGFLYVGIMATSIGPRVVEYNCRLGDPEAQVVLPLYQGDFLELCASAAAGRISQVAPRNESEFCSVIVLASEGYPAAYAKGDAIGFSSELPEGSHFVHAGTKIEDGVLKTSGGRVAGVVAHAETLPECLKLNYEALSKVSFRGMQFRKDIGQKGLLHL